MKYRGVLFDFNGVLLWDSPIHSDVWKQFAVQVRGQPLTDEEVAVHVHGRNNRYTLEYLTGNPLSDEEAARLSIQKETLYQQRCLELGKDYRLSPGAADLLDFLAEHAVPRTIATASVKYNVDFFFRQLVLSRWFDPAQIVYDDGFTPGKPQPDYYTKAAQKLGLDPAECVVVEDSRSGLRSAFAAGAGYIIALGPAGEHAHLLQIEGVNEVIESLVDFPRLVLKLQQ
ncbi:MAG: HAD family hydrolase [Omnitrophica WOR_2 bacterium]